MGYRTITSERGKNSQGDTILSHPTMPPPHIPSMGLKLDTYCI